MARTKERGGVRKRGNVWALWYYDPDGNRVEESARTGDKRVALARLTERRREVREGTWVHPSDRATRKTIAELEAELAAARAALGAPAPAPVQTLEAYLAGWIERRRDDGVRNVRNEANFFALHVVPVIGAIPLGELTRQDVRRMVSELSAKTSPTTGQPYAPRTVIHVYRALATAMNDAVADGLIEKTPCTLKTRRGELPKKRDAELRWRARAVYTRDEVEALISDERIPMDRRTFYALMLLAGMRTGEAAGRLWRDYDANAQPLGKLTVSTQAASGGEEAATKTGDFREVPVHPTLAAILAEWRLVGFPQLFGRPPRPDDPIVPSRALRRGQTRFRGKASRYERLRDDIALIGLRRPPALQHSMRATFLSLLEVDGANMGIVRRATHGSPSDVLGGYLRPPWPAQCEEIGRLNVSRRGRASVAELPRAMNDSAAPRAPTAAVSAAVGSERPKRSMILVGDAGFEAAPGSGIVGESRGTGGPEGGDS